MALKIARDFHCQTHITGATSPEEIITSIGAILKLFWFNAEHQPFLQCWSNATYNIVLHVLISHID